MLLKTILFFCFLCNLAPFFSRRETQLFALKLNQHPRWEKKIPFIRFICFLYFRCEKEAVHFLSKRNPKEKKERKMCAARDESHGAPEIGGVVPGSTRTWRRARMFFRHFERTAREVEIASRRRSSSLFPPCVTLEISRQVLSR